MAYPSRQLTDAEREEFLKNNQHGILSFTGDEPYAVPMGFRYKKGIVFLGFATAGRKLDYFQKSRKVCFTVCTPRWFTPELKESCISVIVEGELEEVTDRSYYGLPPIPPKPAGEFQPKFLRIKVNKIGTRKCLQEPCELFAQKKPDQGE